MATSSYSGPNPLVSTLTSVHEQQQHIQPTTTLNHSTTTNPLNTLFTVTRQEPELIPPSKPTPHGLKPISDIDNQQSFHFQVPIIQFYPNGPTTHHPATLIRAALADALVWYYPLAGRLRQLNPNNKLVVDCNAEGVLFIEAEADITLHELITSNLLKPPFPSYNDLLYDIPSMSRTLDSPLILVQVTRLKCNGFIIALRFNHIISDATGTVQFMNTVAEFSRGQRNSPSITPIWDRYLLNARDPPRVTCTHPQYDELNGPDLPFKNVIQRSFFFGPDEISALRKKIPSDFQCTRFELISATVWRCRTIAIQLQPHEEVRFICAVNARSKFNPPIPNGYYGNAFALSGIISTVDELEKNPLSYAVRLIQKAKAEVTEEYMMSVADLMALTGGRHVSVVRTHVISDLSRVGFDEVDYGWGKPVYGGPGTAGAGCNPVLLSFFSAYKTGDGQKGILYPIYLPKPAMERFEEELRKMLN